MTEKEKLIKIINDELPQTQCTRCSYPSCNDYAAAIVNENASINQCPPGGEEGILKLSKITGQEYKKLNPENGIQAPRNIVYIDETWCIGCTLCIKACPVDCIIGASKQMHTIIEQDCTGCELCIPACPVDCIYTENASGQLTGWAAWSIEQAQDAKKRYEETKARRIAQQQEHNQKLEEKAKYKLEHLSELTKFDSQAELDRKRAVVEAALKRAREKRLAQDALKDAFKSTSKK